MYRLCGLVNVLLVYKSDSVALKENLDLFNEFLLWPPTIKM